MIKALNKLRIQGTFLNILKDIHENIDYIILDEEKDKLFPLK
jgi:hypothetical protein